YLIRKKLHFLNYCTNSYYVIIISTRGTFEERKFKSANGKVM
ncbi:unnamed protein product, partial [Tenebrio molitor]